MNLKEATKYHIYFLRINLLRLIIELLIVVPLVLIGILWGGCWQLVAFALAIPVLIRLVGLLIRYTVPDRFVDFHLDPALEEASLAASTRLEIGEEGLDDELQKMIVYGPSEHLASVSSYWVDPARQGLDRKYRFAIYGITVVMLSSERFGVYQCSHRIRQGDNVSIRITEFPYERISSLRLEEDLETTDGQNAKEWEENRKWWQRLLNLRTEILPIQTLVISIDGSDPIRLSVVAPRAGDRQDGSKMDAAIALIRSELQERRRQALPPEDAWG